MKLAELTQLVVELTQRVAALEASQPPPRRLRTDHDLGLVQSLIDSLPAADGGNATDGAIVDAGAGPGPDGLTAFQMEHAWNELLYADPAPIALCLAALGNPLRIQILQMLLRGPATTGELSEALETPSAGQLFHHLKELLAAGLIHQPNRGVYATRPHHVIPLLTTLSSATDLAVPTEQGDQ